MPSDIDLLFDTGPKGTLWGMQAVFPHMRDQGWGRIVTKSEGAHDIRSALRELSSFVYVKLVSNKERLPRTFAVAFQDDSPGVLDDR